MSLKWFGTLLNVCYLLLDDLTHSKTKNKMLVKFMLISKR